jgi:hypothetical protein
MPQEKQCRGMGLTAGTTPRSALSRLAVFATLLCAGCPDPAGKFDDFVGRSEKIDLAMPAVDMATPSGVFDVTGEFLLAISTTLAPDAPLQLISKNTLTPNNDGTATLSMTLTPLTISPERMPVMGMITKPDIAVSATGTFTADFGRQMVPGSANPISGSDITATLVLMGAIKSADRFCGDLSGHVFMPLDTDLMGTWSAIRVPPGTVGMALPPPEVKCPAGAAGDGGVDAATPADLATPTD